MYQQINPDSLCIIMASEDLSKLIMSKKSSHGRDILQKERIKMNKMNKIRCFINIKFQLAFVMKISDQTIIYTFTLQA